MLLLVVFCTSSLPIPIRIPEIPEINSSDTYPCKGGACGCKSAHQCWTSCCCNSPAKRAAWAKKNRVTPPTYAILEEPAQENPPLKVVLRKRISSNLTGDSCCGASDNSCKDADFVLSNASKAKPPAVLRKIKRSHVLTMLALNCQGKDSVFTHLPWMALSMPQLTVALEHVPVMFDRLPVRVLISVPLDLDTPPPKATFA